VISLLSNRSTDYYLLISSQNDEIISTTKRSFKGHLAYEFCFHDDLLVIGVSLFAIWYQNNCITSTNVVILYNMDKWQNIPEKDSRRRIGGFLSSSPHSCANTYSSYIFISYRDELVVVEEFGGEMEVRLTGDEYIPQLDDSNGEITTENPTAYF
jgi:hypothetical protein